MVIIEPKPLIWRRASWYWGWVGVRDRTPVSPCDAARNSRCRVRCLVLLMRTARVLIPRSTSQHSKGERSHPPISGRRPASRPVLSGANDHSAQAVGMAIEKLGRGVDHHVRAQLDGLLEVGRHEGVVHHEFAPSSDGAWRAMDRRSVMRHQRIGRGLDVNVARGQGGWPARRHPDRRCRRR